MNQAGLNEMNHYELQEDMMAHISPLLDIDTSPMTELEAQDYVIEHRHILFANLQNEIIKPIQEIKHYRIFKLNKSDKCIKININIIEELSVQILKEVEKCVDSGISPTYNTHLWKLIFVIPPIYNSRIKGRPSVSEGDVSLQSERSNFSTKSIASSSSENERTQVVESLKYISELIPKKEIDKRVSDFELSVMQKMNSIETIHIHRFLTKLFTEIHAPFPDIAYDKFESSFDRRLSTLIVDPVLRLFSFVHDEVFESHESPIYMQHFLGSKNSYCAKIDNMIFKGNLETPLGLIEVKRPDLTKNYLLKQINFLILETRERSIMSHILLCMLKASQKYAIITDLLGMTFIELPIDANNISSIYSSDEHMLSMRHSIIKTNLTEDEKPLHTVYNDLESRTAIAVLIHKNLADFQPQNGENKQLMRELFEIIKEGEKGGIHQRLEKSMQNDYTCVEAVSSTNKGESIERDKGFLETDFIPDNDDPDFELLYGFHLSLSTFDTPNQWYNVLRPFVSGDHLCEIAEIKKSTFIDLFKPDRTELKLLSRCRGSSLVLKCYTEEAAFRYFYEKLDGRGTDFFDEYEFFDNFVSKEYFLREVKANIAIMKHNLNVEETDPQKMISSPVMVKCGTLIDHGNSFHGKYLIFEALEKSSKVDTHKIKKLSDIEKGLVKRELEKLHTYVNISHGDVARRNLFVDADGVPHFIDFDCSHKLTPENRHLLVRKDMEDCDEMLYIGETVHGSVKGGIDEE